MHWCSEPLRRKARSRHTCMLCLCTIEPGTTYTRWCSGADAVATVKVHSGCWELVERYGQMNADWGWYEVTPETYEEARAAAPDLVVLALVGQELKTSS